MRVTRETIRALGAATVVGAALAAFVATPISAQTGQHALGISVGIVGRDMKDYPSWARSRGTALSVDFDHPLTSVTSFGFVGSVVRFADELETVPVLDRAPSRSMRIAAADWDPTQSTGHSYLDVFAVRGQLTRRFPIARDQSLYLAGRLGLALLRGPGQATSGSDERPVQHDVRLSSGASAGYAVSPSNAYTFFVETGADLLEPGADAGSSKSPRWMTAPVSLGVRFAY